MREGKERGGEGGEGKGVEGEGRGGEPEARGGQTPLGYLYRNNPLPFLHTGQSPRPPSLTQRCIYSSKVEKPIT